MKLTTRFGSRSAPDERHIRVHMLRKATDVLSPGCGSVRGSVYRSSHRRRHSCVGKHSVGNQILGPALNLDAETSRWLRRRLVSLAARLAIADAGLKQHRHRRSSSNWLRLGLRAVSWGSCAARRPLAVLERVLTSAEVDDILS
ncbi:hypothetical protein AB1N83_011671 [Pleurotus pulmonarius]